MNPNPPSTSGISTRTAPSADAIGRRAYEIWEREGRPDGADLRHWLQAEQELSAAGSAGTPSATAAEPVTRTAEVREVRTNGGAEVRPTQSTRTAATRDRRAASSTAAEKSATPPAVSTGRRK